jgi:Lysophospholipase
MIKEGYVVYLFDYDTRKYSSETLQNLHQLISKVEESEVYLVGHSMGGLVARNYIHQYENNIKGLVTIATPHNQSICAHNATKRFKIFSELLAKVD